MKLSNHLQDVLDKQIPKGKWFTADDVILISRTDWVLSKLVEAGAIKKEWQFGEMKYYCKKATTELLNH